MSTTTYRFYGWIERVRGLKRWRWGLRRESDVVVGPLMEGRTFTRWGANLALDKAKQFEINRLRTRQSHIFLGAEEI